MSPDANRILDFLASAGPYANTTAEKEVVREILLTTGGSVLQHGRLMNVVAKHIGAGVYKLTLSAANP